MRHVNNRGWIRRKDMKDIALRKLRKRFAGF
jgi:hypothetical protein